MTRRRVLVGACLLILATAGVFAQPLSNQILQLLTRVNTWTGRNTFHDLRLASGLPADTASRLYNVSGTLYWNGATVAGGGGGGANHTILSTTHTDSTTNTVLRGALITGQGASPTWSRLVLGTAGQVLRSDGTDVVWSSDGSGLTTLNASNLSSGTVPLARLSNITNTEIAAAAGITWGKLNLTGSSLGDLTTRSATDLTSGTLPDARLSVNVTQLGNTIESTEITNGTIVFADWASNSCTNGQSPQYNGSAWVCATLSGGGGGGSVTSVGLSAPAIFTVAGSPVTTSGTLALSLANQNPNLVWSGPSSGGAAAPTFRSLVYADLPTSAAVAGTYPKVTINAQGIVTGTATQITLTTDVTGVLPLANGGTGLNAAVDDTLLLSNGTTWAATAVPNCPTTGITYTTATNSFACAGATGAHNILSASHPDTVTASAVAGDMLYANGANLWTKLAISASNRVLISTGTAPAWSATPSLTSIALSGGVTVSSTQNISSTEASFSSGTVVFSNTGQSSLGTGAVAEIVASNQPSYKVRIIGAFTEAASGTHSRFSSLEVLGGTGTAGGAAVTETVGVYIDRPPTNIATTSYSIFADQGVARFDDGIIERGRSVLMGEWASRAYSAGNYTASGSMTWTVESGDIGVESYTKIGKTLIMTFQYAGTTVGGTVSSDLKVTLPDSHTVFTTSVGTCAGTDNGTVVPAVWDAPAAGTVINIRPSVASPNWTLSTNNTLIRCHVVVPIN